MGLGIEPRSPGPLANTLPIRPMSNAKHFQNSAYLKHHEILKKTWYFSDYSNFHV